MRSKRINFSTVSSKVVIMKGGLNENISSLELKGGELTAVSNYEMIQGSKGGYTSIEGYERYDGTELASNVGATEADDTAREARRTAILEVPGSGPTLGLHIFKNELYAFRNHTDDLTAKMWIASGTGWVEIDTSGDPLDPDGQYNFVNYNFDATITTLAMYWVDGINKARAYDGTTLTTIDNAGMDPDDAPTTIAANDNRLFLGYRLGSLQSSTLGDPTDWVTSPDEIGVGSEITNLKVGVGNTLIVFCDEAIKVLNGTADRATWSLDTFSDTSGSYFQTAARMFGTMFFMDDRGVTSLTAVDAFGDFASNGISQKIYETLQEFKSLTTVGIAARDKNQYRLFFNNNVGAYFSFNNKRLVGVTLVRFEDEVITACEGEDSEGTNIMFFGSVDGMVYKMDSGTSFDGEPIPTLMSTAFYHYGTPRAWKKFHSVVLEIATINEIDLKLRTLFDYNETNLPRTARVDLILTGLGGVWGIGKWGEMIYSSGQGTSRLKHYCGGLASNMSVELVTTEKYATPHTVQNMIVDYEVSRRQL